MRNHVSGPLANLSCAAHSETISSIFARHNSATREEREVASYGWKRPQRGALCAATFPGVGAHIWTSLVLQASGLQAQGYLHFTFSATQGATIFYTERSQVIGPFLDRECDHRGQNSPHQHSQGSVRKH